MTGIDDFLPRFLVLSYPDRHIEVLATENALAQYLETLRAGDVAECYAVFSLTSAFERTTSFKPLRTEKMKCVLNKPTKHSRT